MLTRGEEFKEESKNPAPRNAEEASQAVYDAQMEIFRFEDEKKLSLIKFAITAEEGIYEG